jgi:hypothetical protein
MRRDKLRGLAGAFLLCLPGVATAREYVRADVRVVSGYERRCDHWRDRDDDHRRCRREEWREHRCHRHDRDRDRCWR